uniref:HGWP repeat containing protein-like n=1 Tax=Oryza sativa subsp. japonica TaxID=39947 RepID=Q5VMH2_ORYSJ|nr:HGWP repeat containing protein-like [Oryza sativa Japonica Group]BAD69353.1 HGWP repeat containing protein-like [Oryza sativa Japonica Group]
MFSSMKEVGRKVIDKQKHALHRSRKTPNCNCPATVTLSLSKQDDLGKNVSMKARSEIFNSVSDATRSEKCKHRLPAPLFRFRRSPLALAVGFVLAPCSALSAVAAELRFAAAVAPVLLPTRRPLRPLRRVAADPVRRSAPSADCRSAVALVIPSRAAVFLRSVRRFRRLRCLGVSRGPPFAFPLSSSLSGATPPRRWSPAATIGARVRAAPVGRAGEAALGRALAAAKWARPSAARARGCG